MSFWSPKHKSRFPKRRDAPPGFYDYLRSKGCQARDDHCWGTIEIDHVRTVGGGGTDFGNTVGLCKAHHAMRHNIGIKTFQAKYGDMVKRASELKDSYEDWAA